VAMVLWHTADGWLQPGERVGQSWVALRFVGGLAAPSFLFLAGTGIALAARTDRAPRSLLAELARGLEILLFGYALRYQGWLIDANAIGKLYLLRAWLPLGLGYGLLYLSLRSLDGPRRRALGCALLGVLCCALGFVQIPELAPGRLPRLLQVDVLQAIGASLVLLTLGERACALLQRPALAAALGLATACATGAVYDMLPGPLPVPMAAYLGKFSAPVDAPVPALFPLFPWFSYALFGAALGTLLRIRSAALDRIVVFAALAGALLALLTSESHRFVQLSIAQQAWLVHPLRVAYRIGLVLVLLWIGWLWAEAGRGRILVRYGRASLRIYWAHLLVAYGVCGSLWHKRLTMGKWAAGVSLLLAAMWLLGRIGADALGPRKRAVAPGRL